MEQIYLIFEDFGHCLGCFCLKFEEMRKSVPVQGEKFGAGDVSLREYDVADVKLS